MFNLLLTLLFGGVLGFIFNKLKVPSGFLIGSMIGAATLNIFFASAYMPNQTKIIVQIIAGAFIGCIMEKSDVKRLPQIWKPTMIMLMALLILNLTAGFLIYYTSPLDLTTSLMSVVPGGISDTPIIAVAMGADGPKVAVMQLARQILGIAVLPGLIFAWDQRSKKNNALATREAYTKKRQKSKTKSWQAFLCTLAVASIFGLLGNTSGLPSATFVFPIISVLVLKLFFDFAYIPRWAKKIAQVLSGCYLGSTVSSSNILELRYLLLPLFIVVVGYTVNCFLTGKLISHTCHFTQKEAMLITTPAGASDMALISADLGVENTDIIILQVVRAVVVMTLFPQIIGLILRFAQGGL